jgi:hypothetical protein
MTSKPSPTPKPSPGTKLGREIARLVRPRTEPTEPRQLGVHDEFDD